MKAWFLSSRSTKQKSGAMTLKWSGTDFAHVRAPIPSNATTLALAALSVLHHSSH